jgi:HEAT repeat protein
MPEALDALLASLLTTIDTGDAAALMDEIENLVEDDRVGSRSAILAYPGDAGTRVRLLGFLADPHDFDAIAACLSSSDLRYTALEALTSQPDGARVDTVARLFLEDTDPRVRAKAVGMVSFFQQPGALAALLPLTDDPIPLVRMVLAWELGQFDDAAATAALHALSADPDDQVRAFATRGRARLSTPRRHDQDQANAGDSDVK